MISKLLLAGQRTTKIDDIAKNRTFSDFSPAKPIGYMPVLRLIGATVGTLRAQTHFEKIFINIYVTRCRILFTHSPNHCCA